MARTSYANVLALPDSAQGWNFDLFFPTIPGTSISAAGLTYACKSTEIPASTIEAVDIALHGTTKKEAGRATYEHTFPATFLGTVDWSTFLAMRAWRNKMRSWKENSGSNSQAYKVNLELDLYDNAGEVALTLILAGSFPLTINGTQLNGAESTAVEVSMNFSFDYVSDLTGF